MLQIATDQELNIDLKDVIGESIAVLGIKGSGKSNTGAVLAEEMLPHLPMTVVDIEGEWYGLKEKFDILVIGCSEHADLDVSPDQAPALAEFSIRQGVSVILDLSDYDQEQAAEFLLAYFQRLWEVGFKARKPYEIVVEEAHEWLPQGESNDLKKVLSRFALRGRKRGFGLITISQRSARVDKDVLTQASLVFLHRVVHPRDMSVYKDMLPLKGADVEQRVMTLQSGQALVLHHGEVSTVRIRKRYTYHAGATPGTEDALPTLRKVDAKLLAELKTALGASKPQPQAANADLVESMTAEIGRLKKLLAQKEIEIEWLKKEQPVQLPLSPESYRPPDMRETSVKLSGAMSEPVQVMIAEEPYVSPLAMKRRVGRQQKGYDELRRKVSKLPKYHQEILTHLMTYPDLDFDLNELAPSLGYSVSTLIANPPASLVRLGLVTRTRVGKHPYRYQSNARQFLTRTYPNLDTNGLLKRLVK